jgi:plasmid maintenance system antidote protein VapI
MAKNPTPLRLAIVLSGRTQRDIAGVLGMHESRLSLIVNGEPCDAQTQSRIAAALCRDVADLFAADDDLDEAA